MTMVGGNLEQLRVLEQRFTADAEEVGDLQRRITATLNNTTWTGPAASGTAASSGRWPASRRR